MSRRAKRRAHDARALKKMFGRIALACAVVPAAVANACSSSSSSPSPADSFDASNGLLDSGNADGEGDANALCTPATIAVDAANPDGGIECGIFERFSCALPPNVVPRSDCYFELNDCPALCPGVYFFNCHAYGNWCVDGSVLADEAGIPQGDGAVVTEDPVIVECQACPNGAGRRPQGLRYPHIRARTALGRYFAEIAYLEHASVFAFRMLRRDLAYARAPRSLLTACSRAARDEIRHARTTRAIARRHCATPFKMEIERASRARSLEEIAIENAIEGCVNETYGALVATWQSAHAEDPAIAEAFAAIAEDETRHAALAWRLARWLETRLDRNARARVTRARRRAFRELSAAATATDPDGDVARFAGVPSVRVRRRMVRELRRSLGP